MSFSSYRDKGEVSVVRRGPKCLADNTHLDWVCFIIESFAEKNDKYIVSLRQLIIFTKEQTFLLQIIAIHCRLTANENNNIIE